VAAFNIGAFGIAVVEKVVFPLLTKEGI